MARNPSMYTGLCQGAATRRNRYLRAAHTVRAILRSPMSAERARSQAQWDLRLEGAFLMSDAALIELVQRLYRDRLAWLLKQIRYWHADWKRWTFANREWRKEMKDIDLA